jgi:hypothetical protein
LLFSSDGIAVRDVGGGAGQQEGFSADTNDLFAPTIEG